MSTDEGCNRPVPFATRQRPHLFRQITRVTQVEIKQRSLPFRNDPHVAPVCHAILWGSPKYTSSIDVPRLASWPLSCFELVSVPTMASNLVAAASLAARGSGGRSSVSGIAATVFGSTGFLGRYVTSHLGRIGSQVSVPFRGDELLSRHLKVMGDVGQVVPVPFELRDEQSVRDSIRGSNVVINLMGKHFETPNYKYADIHVDAVRLVAELAREEGVSHFVHMSTVPPLASCTSRWLATKQEGEQIVREVYPDATIVRATDMFGMEDRFFTRMASNIYIFGNIVLHNYGESRVQPVWVNDIASVVAAAARDPERYAGKTLELGGPDVLSIREIHELICTEVQRTTRYWPLPTKVVEIGAKLGNMRLPFAMPNPTYSADAVLMEASEIVLDKDKAGVLRFEDLDAVPMSVHSDLTKQILRRFRSGGDRSSLFYVD